MNKRISLLFSFLFLFSSTLFAQPKHGKVAIGYYAQWAIYSRNYKIPSIDGSKLTHLNYAFFGLTYDPARPELTNIKSLDNDADFGYDPNVFGGNLYALQQLKIKYPHLKILISIGGWTRSQPFPLVAANPAARVGLAKNMAAFLRQYPFLDGFDLDWEFPVVGGIDGVSNINGNLIGAQTNTPDDQKNLVYLVKAMRAEMPNKLITIGSGNNVRNVAIQYVGPKNRAQYGLNEDLTTFVDYISYFGYDLGGNWYDKTCYNAPLYPSGNPDDPLNHDDGKLPKEESIDELTHQYLDIIGIPANKLVQGLPFYGKLFNSVANDGKIADKPGLFVAAPRGINPACASPQPPAGTWDPANFPCEFSGAIEICDLAGNVGTNAHHYLDPVTMLVTPTATAAGWVRYWDSTARVPYLYNKTSKQFLMYDDKQSIDEKVKYANSRGLAGVMIWELSQDVRENPANGLLAQVDKSLGTPVAGTASISGSVKKGTTLVPGATVELRDSGNNVIQTVTAATDGSFKFNNVIVGSSYTVTATRPTYLFTPTSVPNVNQDVTGVIVQGTQPTFTISGTVLNGTTPVSGVTVTATAGTTSVTGVSSATGAYSIQGLLSGQDYTLVPTKPNLSYLPLSVVIPALTANVTQNFTQSAVLINPNFLSGTVKKGATPVPGAVVELILQWTDNSHPYKSTTLTTDSNGVYSVPNDYIAGYKTMNLTMNTWQNAGTTYFPTALTGIPVPTVRTTYDFNSSSVSAQVAITNPASATLSGSPGSTITLSADASLTLTDATTTITAVSFNINGTTIVGSKSTGNNYNASWTPAVADYNKTYTLTVTATASNGTTATDSRSFLLQCTGANCPNKSPVVNWLTPAGNSLNQASGFVAVPVSVDVTDADGTIASVSLSIDGSSVSMTKGTGNTYTYSFTPNAYKTVNFIVTATDNSGAKTTLNRSLDIVKSSFTTIPPRVILGYAHGWENASAPFLFFRDIANTKFNMVAYAFIETANTDGYTPNLVINEPRYLTGGVFNSQLLKDDIAFLKSKGIPVIVSIGGQNGHVSLASAAQKTTFVNGMKVIIDKYGFDGVDIDFEGGSMDFGAGGLRDFSYAGIAAYPKLKNVVDAFKELKAHYGSGFIITAAPETFYVQVGQSTYTNRAGSFLPVIENLREELDLLMVQLYNTGSVNGLDGIAYSQATPDFLVSMSEMLMTGFTVASTGFSFKGLPPSKIVIGIPACGPAAPAGGYIAPTKGIQAFDYLTKGTTFSGRTYTLRGGPYPNLRGVMTWSINWDKGCGTGFEFSNAYSTYFASLTPLAVNDIKLNNSVLVYFKDNSLVVTNELSNITKVEVYNTLGQSLASYDGNNSNKTIYLDSQSFSTKQLFIVNVTDNLGNKSSYKVLNFLN